MDKNTILAIVLSTLVLFVSLFVQTVYVAPKQQAAAQAQQIELEAQKALEEEKAREEQSLIDSVVSADNETSKDDQIPLQEFTVTTKKAKVVLTNRGGDIISYQLLEHKDKDTGLGVEMADNVSEMNRAFSISFGGPESSVINENFNVKVFDDYTIGFFKTYEFKDESGNTRPVTLGKKYTFMPDDYVFKLDVTLKTGDGGLDFNGASYTIRTAPQIGPHYDRKHDRYEVRQFISFNGSKKTVKPITDKTYDKPYDWAGVAGKYFTTLVKPVAPLNMQNNVKTSVQSSNDYENAQIFLTRNPVESGDVNDSYYIYVGPRSENELIKYNSKEKNSWGLSGVKFNQALQTSGMLSWIEIVLKWILEKINIVMKNWGISIIILTIILKIVLFPLNKNSAMGSLKMQELQPKMTALQEKYKDDQQKLSIEMQKLYKEVGYNPMKGCLPMILQMIILFALYNVFNNYFEFRGAEFIPGWIDDLSKGDVLFTWNKHIPFISGFTMNTLRLLPFIYTASQLLNGVITQYGGSAGGGAAQKQMKFMMYGMPIMFFFLFYNVPSGLLLYWTVSNILQIGQQLVINNVMKKKRAEMEKAKPVVNSNVLKFKGGKKKTR